MLIALTREVSPSIANCELTHLDRQPILYELAQTQHHHYENCLRDLGCEIHRLPVEPNLPDAVFVEDTALVLDELAIITRPGAASRQSETASMAKVLEQYRKLIYLQSPATLDGGDVLRIGKTLYVGLTRRSNQYAFEQIQAAASPHGYRAIGVEVNGCLHLKSAVTQIAPDTMLINSQWVDSLIFKGMKFIEVDETEPYGGNALLIGETVIYPTSYPNTHKRIEAQGIPVRPVEVSELIKAEGAVTCCSVVFNR